jgi:hypothetical protein
VVAVQEENIIMQQSRVELAAVETQGPELQHIQEQQILAAVAVLAVLVQACQLVELADQVK